MTAPSITTETHKVVRGSKTIRRFEIFVDRHEDSPEFEDYEVWDRDYFDTPGQAPSKDLVIYHRKGSR